MRGPIDGGIARVKETQLRVLWSPRHVDDGVASRDFPAPHVDRGNFGRNLSKRSIGRGGHFLTGDTLQERSSGTGRACGNLGRDVHGHVFHAVIETGELFRQELDAVVRSGAIDRNGLVGIL